MSHVTKTCFPSRLTRTGLNVILGCPSGDVGPRRLSRAFGHGPSLSFADRMACEQSALGKVRDVPLISSLENSFRLPGPRLTSSRSGNIKLVLIRPSNQAFVRSSDGVPGKGPPTTASMTEHASTNIVTSRHHALGLSCATTTLHQNRTVPISSSPPDLNPGAARSIIDSDPFFSHAPFQGCRTDSMREKDAEKRGQSHLRLSPFQGAADCRVSVDNRLCPLFSRAFWR